MMRFEKTKNIIKGIAAARITILYGLASETMPEDTDLARSYVRLLKRISSHYKVSIPTKLKQALCRCNAVLIPGISAKVNIASSNSQIIYTCLVCNTKKRINYSKNSRQHS